MSDGPREQGSPEQPGGVQVSTIPPVTANRFIVDAEAERDCLHVSFGWQVRKGAPDTFFQTVRLTLPNAQWLADLLGEMVRRVEAGEAAPKWTPPEG